jgi:hypothetical protein
MSGRSFLEVNIKNMEQNEYTPKKDGMGFKKLDTSGYMENIFNKMKEHDHFKNYPTYQDWCKANSKETKVENWGKEND